MSRKLLSKILIIAGVLCFAVLIAYEAATFPWDTVFSDSETLISSELPDPTMPPFDFELMTPGPTSPTSFNNAYTPDIFGTTDLQAVRLSFDGENTAVSGTGNVAVGIIKIARIGISEWIWEGTESKQLKEGVGYQIGTALPNEEGNVVLSAHRTSMNSQPFKQLDKMQIGDYVTIKFWDQNYNYQVYEIMVVGQHDAWVMDEVPGEDRVLTLITCDPLVWVGHRPNRLVVRARLIDITDVEQ